MTYLDESVGLLEAFVEEARDAVRAHKIAYEASVYTLSVAKLELAAARRQRADRKF